MSYKKRPAIGVLIPNVGWWYSNLISEGLTKEAALQKVNLRFFIGGFLNSHLLEEKMRNCIYDLVSSNCIDGLITLSGPLSINFNGITENFEKYLKRFAPLPVISIGVDLADHLSVLVDNKKAMAEVTDHMIEVHRYQKLAYVSGPRNNYESMERLAGYKQSLRAHNIPIDDEYIFYGTFQPSDGIRLPIEIFDSGKSWPEAIICASDIMMVFICNAMIERGIKVPGDIAIAGYDNKAESEFYIPPLTTVDQSAFKQGEEAVRLMVSLLSGDSLQTKKKVIIPTELFVRESCGCKGGKKGKWGLIKEDPSQDGKMDSLEWIYKKARVCEKEQKKIISGLYNVLNEDLSKKKREGARSGSRFIEKLKTVVYNKNRSGKELQTWYAILDTLFFYAAGNPGAKNKKPLLEKIEKSAFRLLGKTKYLVDGAEQLANTRLAWDVRHLLEGLMGCYSLEDLLDLIEDQFHTPRLKQFFLLLYDGDKLGYSKEEIKGRPVRVHIGFSEEKVIRYKQSVPFLPDRLLPEDITKVHCPENLIIYSICAAGKYYGFVIYKYDSSLLSYYELIRTRLCQLFDMIYNFTGIEQIVKERTGELEKANARLHELDRVKTNFIANISHELRTPLTLILGPVEGILAGDYGKKIDNDNSIFKSVINNSSRLLKLITNLLDYSKIEAGKMQLTKKKTNMYKLLHYYVSIIGSSGTYRGIDIELENKTGEVSAWIDRDLMEKALFNLFSNSLKFTSRGGKITICLDSDKDCFSISVKDTGIGIPGDKLETIFDRFTQVDDGASRKYEGTGIGLAFTKEIVVLHKGSIAVESIYGKGAVFTITLPYGREKSEEKETEPEGEDFEDNYEIRKYLLSDIEMENTIPALLDNEEDRPGEKDIFSDKRKKILVVDDNSQIRSFLKSIIGRHYRVVTADSGITALEKASFHMPDLIISDVMMAGMDGIELCHKLKGSEKLKHIPLILLTARTDFSLKIAGLEGKADDFISKPFNSKELLTRVKNLLHSRELQGELSRKQNTIMSSVKYAGKIQTASLPKKEEMQQVLQDFFIFWQPRDIVGGDIYWFKKVGENFILAVIDCTGHSVPGAFLAMTVQAELNTVVEFISNDNPAFILHELNKRIKKTLGQENEEDMTGPNSESDDGLDMALCYFDKKEKKLLFAGARRPLYYVQNNKMIEVKADRMSIGYRMSPVNFEFTNHEVNLTGDEVFYLTSDGYADQLGGEKGIGFGKEHLKELLFSIHREKMTEQKKILEKKLKEYRNQWKQTDDITVFGLITLNRTDDACGA